MTKVSTSLELQLLPLFSPQQSSRHLLTSFMLLCISCLLNLPLLPSMTADEALITSGTNSHQNRCRGSTSMFLGKSDPWCVISAPESNSEVLAPVLSEAVQNALQKEKDINFPGKCQHPRRCHFLKENCWGYDIRDISHRHEDIHLAKDTLTRSGVLVHGVSTTSQGLLRTHFCFTFSVPY